MRPWWSYYGSAWRKAQAGLFPAPDPSIPLIEPFAGAAGYAVFHEHPDVRLYDLNEDVVATWRYLIGVSEGELLQLPDIHVDEHVDELDVCPEARLLIGWWLGRARARPATRPGNWYRKRCERTNGWSPHIRHRLARQLPLIRGWTVRQADYRDSPTGLATRFVDPPFEGKPGRRYPCGSRGFDYTELARWCRSAEGLTIVCERTGAQWLPFWFAGEMGAVVGRCSTAVCILEDGVVRRPQIELLFPEAG